MQQHNPIHPKYLFKNITDALQKSALKRVIDMLGKIRRKLEKMEKTLSTLMYRSITISS
jgi:hypothetical protein